MTKNLKKKAVPHEPSEEENDAPKAGIDDEATEKEETTTLPKKEERKDKETKIMCSIPSKVLVGICGAVVTGFIAWMSLLQTQK